MPAISTNKLVNVLQVKESRHRVKKKKKRKVIIISRRYDSLSRVCVALKNIYKRNIRYLPLEICGAV